MHVNVSNVILYHLYNRHLSNVTKVSAKINIMQNINILRFVLTIKQKSGRPPISDVPKPWEGHGWKDNGEPLWFDDDMILPVSLVDILAGDSEELGDSDDDDDD